MKFITLLFCSFYFVIQIACAQEIIYTPQESSNEVTKFNKSESVMGFNYAGICKNLKASSVKPFIFDNIEFSSSIFSYKKVLGVINFLDCSFTSAKFEYSEFNDQVYFGRVDLYAPASFNSSVFNNILSFSKTRFRREVSFNWTEFNEGFILNESWLGNKLSFSNSKFKSYFHFVNTILPDTLELESITSIHDLDFTLSSLDRVKKEKGIKCQLKLLNVPFDKLNIRYDDFKLYHPKNLTHLQYEQTLNAFEGLLNNFKNRGYLNSYEEIDKEYQEFKYTSNPEKTFVELAIGHVLNFLNKYWTDYGYQKVRIWYYTGMFFGFFFLINWLTLPFLPHKVYPIDSITGLHGIHIDKFNHAKKQITLRNGFVTWRSLMPAFFYTTLIFFGLRMSTDKIIFKNTGGVIYLYTQYVVGLICLAYLANFIISSNLIGS